MSVKRNVANPTVRLGSKECCLAYFSMGDLRRKRARGRLSPCSAGPVAHPCCEESGFSLVQVRSDSDRQSRPAPSPEGDISVRRAWRGGGKEQVVL